MEKLQVYASMSPMVHIVNVGSAATESVANTTVRARTNSPVLFEVLSEFTSIFFLRELELLECLIK